ncbi:uncharacterized protein OCT59_007936 [Rhizophagus irregularis]|uniref:uncharacterized protein n=1 Tax=Rhizophagus irregularis TaxID=588596 RepID=UPI00332E75FF|nr:hypothetical protein OCT59_007936 [Rhizophagus irregularis]
MTNMGMLLCFYTKFISSVENWFNAAISTKPEIITDDFEQNFRGLVHMSIFKIFIENEVNLHTLEIESLGYHRYDYKTYLNNTRVNFTKSKFYSQYWKFGTSYLQL